jgi:PAS domain-containing protein
MQAVYVVFIAVFVLMAVSIAVKLPRYRRMTKIAEELRSQAGFLEEQRALLQAIQDSVSDGILLVGENGQVKAFNAAALRILSKPLPEMKDSAIRALVQSSSDHDVVQWEDRLIERFKTVVPGYGQLYVFRDITEQKRLAEKGPAGGRPRFRGSSGRTTERSHRKSAQCRCACGGSHHCLTI